MKNTKAHELARKGRNGDTHVAHLADGEMVVPPVISDEVRQRLFDELAAAGIDPAEYMVGGDEMSINPETGLPEFGWFKKVWKGVRNIAGIAAPLAASFIPGVGPVLGAAIGAGGGLLSGGGLKGALLGGVTGGLGAGGANSIIGSMAPGLSAANPAFAKGLSGALTGSMAGMASGAGLKGALLGGALGGTGGYAMGGGFGDFLGQRAYTLPEGVQGPVTQGTGVMGALTRGGTNLAAGGGSSAYSNISPIVSGAIDIYSQNKAADDLENQQREALGYITPIMNERFNPGDLEQTPGYQFNLSQGQKAMDRAASARGGYFSGQAITDASQFAQGLAQNTYQDAYNNWLSDRNQRLGAAGAAAGITQGIGETQASKALNIGQTLSQSASAAMGAMGGGKVYNQKTGTYYDPSQNNTANSIDINTILKQLGYA